MKWTKSLPNFLTRTLSVEWRSKPKGGEVWTLGLQLNLDNPFVEQLRNEGYNRRSLVISLVWWAVVAEWTVEWLKCERHAHFPLTPSYYCDVWVPEGDTLPIRDRALRQYPHMAGVED